ncbi:MAG: hypothetical protein ACPGQR_05355 [Marinirhabdus sp.]
MPAHLAGAIGLGSTESVLHCRAVPLNGRLLHSGRCNTGGSKKR